MLKPTVALCAVGGTRRREDGTEYWQMGEYTRENIGNLYCDLSFDQFTPNNTQRYHFNDGTSRPVAEELPAAGIPREDIVLGFHPPETAAMGPSA